MAIDRCLLVAASKFPAQLVMLVFAGSATFGKMFKLIALVMVSGSALIGSSSCAGGKNVERKMWGI